MKRKLSPPPPTNKILRVYYIGIPSTCTEDVGRSPWRYTKTEVKAQRGSHLWSLGVDVVILPAVTNGVHCRQSADTGPVVGGVNNIGEKPAVDIVQFD